MRTATKPKTKNCTVCRRLYEKTVNNEQWAKSKFCSRMCYFRSKRVKQVGEDPTPECTETPTPDQPALAKWFQREINQTEILTVFEACKMCHNPLDETVRESYRKNRVCSNPCAAEYRALSIEERQAISKRKHDYQGFPTWVSKMLHASRGSVKVKKKRGEDLQHTLTPEFLLDLLERQEGKCAMTGIVLEGTSIAGSVEFKEYRSLKKISLDRIDPPKGYTPGNVQLVTMAANYLANDFPQAEVEEFIREMVDSRMNLREPKETNECRRTEIQMW
jgi:hypothetical protein